MEFREEFPEIIRQSTSTDGTSQPLFDTNETSAPKQMGTPSYDYLKNAAQFNSGKAPSRLTKAANFLTKGAQGTVYGIGWTIHVLSLAGGWTITKIVNLPRTISSRLGGFAADQIQPTKYQEYDQFHTQKEKGEKVGSMVGSIASVPLGVITALPRAVLTLTGMIGIGLMKLGGAGNKETTNKTEELTKSTIPMYHMVKNARDVKKPFANENF